jgi:hypothetical protein
MMDSTNIINVGKYIIRNTPIGHLRESVDNIKNLVGGNILDEKEIQDEITSYEEDHFKQVALNDEKIIISKFNKDGEKFYHDQTKKFKISINPLSENIETLHEISSGSPFRDTLDKFLHEYRDKNYKGVITAINSKGHINKIFI